MFVFPANIVQGAVEYNLIEKLLIDHFRNSFKLESISIITDMTLRVATESTKIITTYFVARINFLWDEYIIFGAEPVWTPKNCVDGLGCGEIKVIVVDERLQEKDRARLGERLRNSFTVESRKQNQNSMELYRSLFSKEDGCDFVLLSTTMLPTSGSTYTALEESMEIIFSFKVKSLLLWISNGRLIWTYNRKQLSTLCKTLQNVSNLTYTANTTTTSRQQYSLFNSSK
ncbi:uncharacterized protein EV154DRAFT_581529 [Mucor mucedo]|uniref:uncharacterized protein n=1 Tax=Mucor mucedo TaxID=29922 RepID=UPI00221E91A9|nr:uncharacterized protein EV154DRAFT_581529 [Mucor mucedo]KAI7893922.1 hypothetical protein EV154DRAFT_581529 [Mucor mucedo]